MAVSAPECGPDLVANQAPGNCGAMPNGGNFIEDTIPFCGIKRTLYRNNLHWGLRYDNTAGTITTTYTIHIYLKNTNWGFLNWVRIIDFSDGVSDEGIYFRKEAASPDRCLEFYPTGVVGPCPYFNDSTYYLLTITRNGTTNTIDIYVNNNLFHSFVDNSGRYAGIAGTPINIYRDDLQIACESGEANFAYLSFTNQYSDQATVNSVYNDICTIANTTANDFGFNPANSCNYPENINVTYTGNIPAPGNGYNFNWNWDGGNVVSGTGMGPFTISWPSPGIKNVTLTVTNISCNTQTSIIKSIMIGAATSTSISKNICFGQTYQGYNVSGIYTDTFLTYTGCDSIRTLNLTVQPALPITNITNIICAGQTYLGYTNSGIYLDTLISANGCDSIRRLVLTVKPISITTINQTICVGEQFLGYNNAGIYKDTFIAVNGCDSIRTLNLLVIPNPLPTLGPDRDICNGDTIILQPGIFNSYIWQDGSTQNFFIAQSGGLYSVAVTGNCGIKKDTIFINEKPCNIEFPSAFSPNGDGKNDEFGILNAINLTTYDLKIYNRWGKLVFKSTSPQKAWNGKLNGIDAEFGVYVWTCTYIRNNKQIFRKGTILLIR